MYDHLVFTIDACTGEKQHIALAHNGSDGKNDTFE
jgi:hypothetical protein